MDIHTWAESRLDSCTDILPSMQIDFSVNFETEVCFPPKPFVSSIVCSGGTKSPMVMWLRSHKSEDRGTSPKKHRKVKTSLYRYRTSAHGLGKNK